MPRGRCVVAEASQQCQLQSPQRRRELPDTWGRWSDTAGVRTLNQPRGETPGLADRKRHAGVVFTPPYAMGSADTTPGSARTAVPMLVERHSSCRKTTRRHHSFRIQRQVIARWPGVGAYGTLAISVSCVALLAGVREFYLEAREEPPQSQRWLVPRVYWGSNDTRRRYAFDVEALLHKHILGVTKARR